MFHSNKKKHRQRSLMLLWNFNNTYIKVEYMCSSKLQTFLRLHCFKVQSKGRKTCLKPSANRVSSSAETTQFFQCARSGHPNAFAAICRPNCKGTFPASRCSALTLWRNCRPSHNSMCMYCLSMGATDWIESVAFIGLKFRPRSSHSYSNASFAFFIRSAGNGITSIYVWCCGPFVVTQRSIMIDRDQ